MAAGEDAFSHRSRREDRDNHHHSRRSHRDEHRDSTSHRSSRRDKDDSSKRRRSRSPSPVRRDAPSSSSDGEHEIHPTLLKFGVGELTEEDYFIRATEFKAWLSESKGKYLDEISSKDARRYFERFARRWNEGKLPDEYYAGKVRSSSAAAGSSSQTRHRWAFTSKASYSSKEQEQLAMIRDNVDTLTNGDSRGAVEARDAERRARKGRSANAEVDGDTVEAPSRDSGWGSRNSGSQPSNPSNNNSSSSSRNPADKQLEREHRQDLDRVAHSESRRRERQDRADQDEAFHGRATGRDRMLEKKRERAANHREFANRRNADDGIEMDDRELYDQEPLPRATTSSSRASDARSSGLSKREQARQERIEERQAEMQEKVSALKEKDRKTMEMFKAIAQERFGGGT
ncbi:uncharacterized protein UTRI_03497_B [Ustilago trichophora]|uniref:Uncharacterized protein n=1 Tax=Ustilago trichophora TaxID=86804 RepID=A0A5C3E360_9BASI|nr:uncharacterized protein UTRI_03497_B [Ustilago trichophora]